MEMKSRLKKLLYSSKTLFLFRCWFVGYYRHLEFFLWKISKVGTSPPLFYKRQVIVKYAKAYNIKVLVETGTYYGDMVDALKNRFEKIYSIEIDPDLYTKAKWRFSSSPNIRLLEGDSGELLKGIVDALEEPCIFWLDAHYSGGVTSRGSTDTPILKELEQISRSKFNNVVMIDDARHFGILPSYPSINELAAFVSKNIEFAKIAVKSDIVEIAP